MPKLSITVLHLRASVSKIMVVPGVRGLTGKHRSWKMNTWTQEWELTPISASLLLTFSKTQVGIYQITPWLSTCNLATNHVTMLTWITQIMLMLFKNFRTNSATIRLLLSTIVNKISVIADVYSMILLSCQILALLKNIVLLI